MSIKNFIDNITLFFFRSFCWLVRKLPENLGRALCLLVVRFFIILLSRSKKVALFNIKTCFPENSETQNLKIYNSSLEVLADNLYTFCIIPKVDKKYSDLHVDAEDFVRTYQKLKNDSPTGAVIFATAHFGCFELAAHLSALKNVPVSILARQLNLPKTDSWWNSIRTKNGNEVYARKGGYKETITRLNQGKNVAILCDQNVKANNAIFVNLFGIPAASTVTIGHAAAATSAPVIFIVLARQKDRKYKVVSREIKTPQNKENLKEFTVQLMQNYHSALEDAIREFPDHWFWLHRRFKTRPEGQKEDFYESVDNS